MRAAPDGGSVCRLIEPRALAPRHRVGAAAVGTRCPRPPTPLLRAIHCGDDPTARDRSRLHDRRGRLPKLRERVDHSLEVLDVTHVGRDQVTVVARDTPEVIECHRVTGDDCYLITAYVRDVEHLERVIDSFAAYGQTTTSIMQSAPVPRRGIVAAVDDGQ